VTKSGQLNGTGLSRHALTNNQYRKFVSINTIFLPGATSFPLHLVCVSSKEGDDAKIAKMYGHGAEARHQKGMKITFKILDLEKMWIIPRAPGHEQGQISQQTGRFRA
jgi:hypothetical protein